MSTTKEVAMVSVSKSFSDAIQFARFCTEQNLNPVDLAQLITLAKRAFKAGESYANTGSEISSKNSDRTSRKFEEYAENLGYIVEWHGLWPSLLKDGKTVYLPDVF